MSREEHAASFAPERRAHVLSMLARDGAVRVSQLMTELDVAPVTLRRDLAHLERRGLLQRVHGGAVAVDRIEAADRHQSSARAATLGAIAMLVPSLNYYWPGVVRGAESAARRSGYTVVLRGASYDLQDERPVLEGLLRTPGLRGLVVAPNTDTPHAGEVVQWLSELPLPTVFVERDGTRQPDGAPVESVTTDHALGAVLAARHLAALGHQRVGLMISRDSPTSRKITAGWKAACEELDLTPADHIEQVLPPRSNPEFSATIESMLDTALSTGVTALMVHSDPEAMAFVDLALNRGISIPEDLSIIAYDDELAELSTPPLTAVSPPRGSVGEAAIELLARRLDDPARPVHRVVLSPRLEVRASAAAPRSA